METAEVDSRRQVLATTLCLFAPLLAAGQGGPRCPRIAHVEAIAERPRLAVDQLEGQVVFPLPDLPRMLGSLSGFCMALFDQDSVQRLAGSTDNAGKFAFAGLEPGDYVLIGQHASGKGGSLRLPIRLSNKPAAGPPVRGLLIRVDMQGPPQSAAGEVIGNLGLRRTLIEMLKADQSVCMEMIDEGMENISSGMQGRLNLIDAQTEMRLEAILREHGWPGIDMVGLDGAEAASVMLQHVGADLQKKALPLVEAAFRAGRVTGPNLAGLVDRVRLSEGRLQLYGTAARPFTSTGEITFHPIEDEAGVDARRAEMGLMPLAEYRELMRALYFPGQGTQQAAGSSPD